MTGPGPDPLEGGPHGSQGPEGEYDAEEEPAGWIPPEQRSWRHPSELFASARERVGAPLSAAEVRRRQAATVLIASGAAAAVLAGILLLVNVGGPSGNGATNSAAHSGTSLTAATLRANPDTVGSVSQTVVSLQIDGPGGSRQACAVAVEEGGLLATDADAVHGAWRITAVTAGGARLRARVVAVDDGSDIALLQVPVSLPVASFADDTQVAAGGRAMVMAMAEPPGGGRAHPELVRAVISAPDAPVTHGTAAGLAAVAVTATSGTQLAGEVLIDPEGQVLGIFDPSGSSAASGSLFLPSYLVLGVSGDLAATGYVRHGWLGITDQGTPSTGPPSPPGVEVANVMPNGAAAQVLVPGDVVTALDGEPVRSMAELKSRLYVLPPGAPVRLVVWRGGKERTVEVDLSSSP